MTNHMLEISPQRYARTAGLLGLVIVVAGIFAEAFVRGALVVSGDAEATANNILASESLFRLGFAGELVMFCCDIALALALYVLLKPVNRNLALLAAFFRLATAIVSGVNSLNHFEVLLLLGGADYLNVIEHGQLQAQALLSLKSHTFGYHISLVFFGFHCLLVGYLLFKSEYLPRILGVGLIIAGLCYLTNSFTNALFPATGAIISPAILLPCLIAELSLTLWLLIKGVNQQKWDTRISS